MSLVRNSTIFAALALSLGAGDAASAAEAVAPATIDLAGQFAVGGFAGGLSDPVPLFASPSGPVLFVVQLPDALAAPETTPAPRRSLSDLASARTLRTHRIGERH